MKLTIAELTSKDRGASFSSDFAVGEKVHLDGEKSILAVVTGHAFYEDRCEVQVSWLHGGQMQTYWVDEWRLSRADRVS